MNLRFSLIATSLFIASTGALAKDICKAGPESGWQAKEVLEKKLKEEGLEVKRIKIDDGCYEVYGKDAKGQKIERFFHPVTLAFVKDGH